jgi:hypothetical protein
MPRAALVLLALLAALLAACGDAATVAEEPPAASQSGSLPDVVEWDGEGMAPPLTLDLDGERVALKPWTACYSNGCYDGSPVEPYYDVGGRDAVPFSFPEEGWEFEATFKEAGVDECYRQITLPVEKTGDRTWSIAPLGPAGSWDVDVFGRGAGGDVITTFTWTTTTNGALPGPASGIAGVLAGHDGELDSYGVEIGVSDLATHPTEAKASVTVTSSEGRSVTLRPGRRDKECYAEGSLYFTASDDEGRRATELGAGPFTYDVELVLDGTTYHGLGEWPTDESDDNAPFVPLTWTPELPAYEG